MPELLMCQSTLTVPERLVGTLLTVGSCTVCNADTYMGVPHMGSGDLEWADLIVI